MHRKKLEFAGVAGLVGLAIWFIAISWRKWPDPVVDFGRELYAPWRIANGAVLFRDLDEFYGPLSQYINGGVFAAFGPGLMVLATANLVIYTAILATLYSLFRRAWGAMAALAACILFVSVFSFSQIAGISNYNFVTPYAHAVTHGFLVCALLTAALLRWIEKPTGGRSFLAGGLLGLTAVLKPEFMLAGGLVTAASFAFRWRSAGLPGRSAYVAWAAGAVLPTLLFTLYFSFYFPTGEALQYACSAWMNVVGAKSYIGDPIQLGYLGLDQPWTHFLEHARSALGAFALLALLPATAWAVSKINATWLKWSLAAAVPVALGIVGWKWIPWLQTGQCLLGLVAGYAVLRIVFLCRNKTLPADIPGQAARLLLAVLGAALMARMVLNGRIYQFGFYQAAIAGMVIVAAVVGEAWTWTPKESWSRTIVVAGAALLFGSGIVRVGSYSQTMLAAKTVALGEGRDRFYGYPEPTKPVSLLVDRLNGQRDIPSLLVLPDGLMINYLTRKPSPVPQYFFLSAVTADGREARIVSQLEKRPPARVILLNHDLREHGIEHYGEKSGGGRELVTWLMANYIAEAQLLADLSDPDSAQAYVFRPRIQTQP